VQWSLPYTNNFGFRVIGASMDFIAALDESQGAFGAYCLANYISSQENWKKVLDAWAEYLPYSSMQSYRSFRLK
jgi:hypothetical protein